MTWYVFAAATEESTDTEPHFSRSKVVLPNESCNILSFIRISFELIKAQIIELPLPRIARHGYRCAHLGSACRYGESTCKEIERFSTLHCLLDWSLPKATSVGIQSTSWP